MLWVRLGFLVLLAAFVWTFVVGRAPGRLGLGSLRQWRAEAGALSGRERLGQAVRWGLLLLIALAAAGAILDFGRGLVVFDLRRGQIEIALFYYGLVLLLAVAFPSMAVLWLAAAAVLAGAGAEALQGLSVIDGKMQLRDWIAGAAGACAGALPILLLSWRPWTDDEPGASRFALRGRLWQGRQPPALWLARAALAPAALLALWLAFTLDQAPPPAADPDLVEKGVFWFALVMVLTAFWPQARRIEPLLWLLGAGAVIEVLQALRIVRGDYGAADLAAEAVGALLCLAALAIARIRSTLADRRRQPSPAGGGLAWPG